MHLMVLGASRPIYVSKECWGIVSMHLMVLGASRQIGKRAQASLPRLNAPDGAGCFPTSYYNYYRNNQAMSQCT